MTYPSSITNLEARVQALATNYPTICTRTDLPNKTYEGGSPGNPGRTVSLLRIGTGTGGNRPRLLIVAGVHAREMAPPDAVLTFVEKLLDAYNPPAQPIRYNRVVNNQPGRPIADITFKRFTIPYSDVKRIIERTELYVVVLANPDGRAYVMSSISRKGWRKNRRPAAPGVVCPPLPTGIPNNVLPWVSNDPVGVDINRNFDIASAWDIDTYYSSAAVATRTVGDNRSACNIGQTYRGPSRASEPETKNIEDLIKNKNINFFVDVHSAAAKFLFAWGMARNQTNNTTQTFKNTALDRAGGTGGRDPTGSSPAYAEWTPPGIEQRHQTLGDDMRDAILDCTGYTKAAAAAGATAGATAAQRMAKEAHDRSIHLAVQSVFLFSGPGGIANFNTGISRDYAFSQQIGSTPGSPITATANDPVFSFTFECGRDADGAFRPDAANEYPKIEREVGAGLAKFLSFAATWHAPVPTPTPPSTPTGAPPSSKICFIATVTYGSPQHPQVKFLHDLRDNQIRATPFGRDVMRVVDRVYYSFSPQVAAHLNRHPVLCGLVRVTIVAPAIGMVRGCARLVAGIEQAERRVGWLLGLIATGVGGAAAVAGAVIYLLGRALGGF